MFDPTAAAYALLLGMVAAFNPCGFALLPAYITVIVTGSADESVSRSMAVRRALLFGLAMTLGFMAVFTGFGLLFGAVNLGLQGSILPYVSYVTVALGALLVWLGMVLVRGGELKGPGLRLNSAAPRKTFWSQTIYGVSFAVASLTCTIGLFLAVVTQALAATNPLGAVAPFVVYGVGMGTSIIVVSLLAALAGAGVASALRNKTPVIMRVGGGLMIVAGLYVIVFGLAEVLPQYGIFTLNPVLLATAEWQAAVVNSISGLSTAVLVAVVAVTLAVVVTVFLRGRYRADSVSVTSVGPSSATANPAKGAPVAVASAETLDAVRSATRRKKS
ncbi:MAG: cytochrome C biogenesis protein [Actinobacteria bacterium HGW-Actinobacteria-4]|nr:MAG: cytochrome C biogenesis protein [Actinobacteria bacterium HGW-Actinobacteria-4]